MAAMTNETEASGKSAGLQIIGAGFGRTGTLSLKTALEELGFGPCYHMTEAFRHPEHVAQWRAATNGEPVDWHKLFEGYRATVDWPACTFYAELMETFPDARVLLTVRDPQKWYESVNSTIFNVSARTRRSRLASPPFRLMMRFFMPGLFQMVHVNDALIWQGTFHNRFEDRQYAISVFQQHIEEVRHKVPPEKLLVYDVRQGWEPLCAFLGVPVPDRPFPHLNDRTNFPPFARNLRQQRTRRTAGALTALAAAILLVAFLFMRRRSQRAK
jgi:hypothetical protein